MKELAVLMSLLLALATSLAVFSVAKPPPGQHTLGTGPAASTR